MISVCMATYNGERFIKEQIDSILPQLSKDDELIISDDGSTDRTLEIIASYKDERINVFHHKKNPEYAKIKHSRNFYYATSNFENALKQAKGDYIFLSDQDDVWMPNKVQKMIPKLKEFDCVMSNYNIIDASGRIISTMVFDNLKLKNSYLFNLIKTPFLGCLIGFNQEVLNRILPFPKKLISHDLWIGCIACKKFNMTFINEALVAHRKHTCNTSNVTEKSKNPFFMKIFYRLKLLINLINR